jgi:hypothetical protein
MEQLLNVEEAANLNPLDVALMAIGFTAAQTRVLVENDISDYDSFKLIDKKDVLMVADSYGKRSTLVEQIQFGSNRFNQLVGLMQLVQNYAHRGVSADVNGMLPVTLDFIKMALQHTLIRKDHANNKEIASKAVDPGTLTFKVDFQSGT